MRYVGKRWDDDLNVLYLSPFTVLDVRADRKLFLHTEAFLGLENLLDKDYLQSSTGRQNVWVGTPFNARLTVTYNF